MAPDTRRKKSGFPTEKAFDDALFIHSFSKLCDSLREKGDLPASAKSILNERLLSKIIFQIQLFMESAFGKGSAIPSRTTTKLPCNMFRDFSPLGPLFSILNIAINYQYSRGWETFELGTTDRFQDGVEMVKQMEAKLIQDGHLRRPKVFFGNVPDGKLEELRRIVTSHGGAVVGSAAEASHIVDWDEEVDSMSVDLTEEFVRTLEVRRNPLAAAAQPLHADTEAPSTSAADSKSSRGTALVHWWYHPDSYDEWIPADDIDDTEMPDTIPHSSNRPIDTTWHVCCRFIYDCEVFNEWCNEIDYEIPEQAEGGEEEDGGAAADGSGAPKTRGKARGKKRADQSKLKKETPIVEAIAATEKMLQEAAPPTSDPSVPVVEIIDLQPTGEHVMTKVEKEIFDSEGADALEDPSAMEVDDAVAAAAVKTEGGVGVGVEVDTASSSAAVSDDTKVGGKRKADQITTSNTSSSTAEVAQGTGTGAASTSTKTTSAAKSSSKASTPALPPTTIPDSVLSRLPDWFKLDSVSDFEVKYLPEFFARPTFAYSRTPEDYVKIRNFMLILYAQNPTTYLSATDCRRKIAGDVCVIMKIHEFLDAFRAINFDVKAADRPSLSSSSNLFTKRFHADDILATGVPAAAVTAPSNKGQTVTRDIFGSPIAWDDALDRALLRLVAETNGSDWEAVARGLGKEFPLISPQPTSAECLARFVAIPLAPPTSIRPSGAAAAASTSSSSSSATATATSTTSDPAAAGSQAATSVLGHPPAALQGAYGSYAHEHPDKQLKLVAYHLLQNAVAVLGEQKTADVVKSVLAFMKEKHSGSSEAAKSLAVGVAVLSAVASEEAKTEGERVKELVGEYVTNRLKALEEKMKLIGEVDTMIDLERERLEVDRRDVQIQRSLLAFQSQSQPQLR